MAEREAEVTREDREAAVRHVCGDRAVAEYARYIDTGAIDGIWAATAHALLGVAEAFAVHRERAYNDALAHKLRAQVAQHDEITQLRASLARAEAERDEARVSLERSESARAQHWSDLKRVHAELASCNEALRITGEVNRALNGDVDQLRADLERVREELAKQAVEMERVRAERDLAAAQLHDIKLAWTRGELEALGHD